MKKLTVIFFSVCLFYSIDLFSQENQSNDQLHSINLNQISIEKSANFVKNNALLFTTIPLLFYFHEDLLQPFINHPYISSILFYFLINYACDTVLNCQEQESLVNLILLLKQITLYLVISHGIKNTLEQENASLESIAKKKNIFNTITKKWPYSFDKMTAITLESYQEIKNNLYKLNNSMTIESEEFVYLHHPLLITIDDVLYLTQHDEILHNMISLFEKNPESELEQLLEHLTLKIMFNFLALEQNILKFQIASIAKQQSAS